MYSRVEKHKANASKGDPFINFFYLLSLYHYPIWIQLYPLWCYIDPSPSIIVYESKFYYTHFLYN